MSPEQIRGEKVDGRVDVYALGVILFEMLAGKVPFDRANSVNILMAHIQEEIPSILAFNPAAQVSPALEALVRRCMAKDPVQRYGGMDEVLAALKQCSGIQTTMSGEFRLHDVLGRGGISVDGVNPSSSAVHLRGELPAGGTPYSGMSPSVTPSSTLASPKLPSVHAPAAGNPAKRSRSLWIASSALVLALAGGALSYFAPAKVSPAVPRAKIPTQQLVKAEPLAAPAEAVPAPDSVEVAPDPGPTPVAGVSSTVLVSLRSTPAGAMVVVGDREYGPTPTQVEWTGAEAELGREVTFRFQRKGYRDLTVTRQIRGDRLDVEAPPMDPVPLKQRATREERPQAASAPAKGTAPIPALQGYKAEPY
jgi:serine/threonine-protein kinase